MSSADHIGDHAFVLLGAARAIHETAGEPGSVEAAAAVLARLEEALQLLSAGWYQVAADASPAIIERPAATGGHPAQPPPNDRRLSREQEMRLTRALHDVAGAFARCARICRDARPTLQPLIDGRVLARRHRDEALQVEDPRAGERAAHHHSDVA